MLRGKNYLQDLKRKKKSTALQMILVYEFKRIVLAV